MTIVYLVHARYLESYGCAVPRKVVKQGTTNSAFCQKPKNLALSRCANLTRVGEIVAPFATREGSLVTRWSAFLWHCKQETKMRIHMKIAHYLIALALLMPVAAIAQTIDNLSGEARGSVSDGAQSQQRIDKLDDETSQLVREYRAALSQLQSLREYNTQLEKLIVAQKEEMVSIRKQIEDVTNVDRTIVPLMFRMIDALEQFVKLDVPFLMDERNARLSNLRELMDRSDASPAEKYRKILEAYEIENEYGRTIEAYEGEMEVEGEMRTVAFLRIGRVSLIYQTLDGGDSGVWSQATRTFEDLDGDFDSEIRNALRVAKQQAAPDLLIVPVARTAE